MAEIETSRGKYLIRGNYTADQLRARFAAYKRKYPDSHVELDDWLRTQGAVYYLKRKA